MTKRPYNGFSPDTRMRVGAFVNQQFASGEWERPAMCVGCHKVATETTIQAHDEDYAHPETHVGLCRSCHGWVHRRHNDPIGWQRYLAFIESRHGWTWLHYLKLEQTNLGREAPLPEVSWPQTC